LSGRAGRLEVARRLAATLSDWEAEIGDGDWIVSATITGEPNQHFMGHVERFDLVLESKANEWHWKNLPIEWDGDHGVTIRGSGTPAVVPKR